MADRMGAERSGAAKRRDRWRGVLAGVHQSRIVRAISRRSGAAAQQSIWADVLRDPGQKGRLSTDPYQHRGPERNAGSAAARVGGGSIAGWRERGGTLDYSWPPKMMTTRWEWTSPSHGAIT